MSVLAVVGMVALILCATMDHFGISFLLIVLSFVGFWFLDNLLDMPEFDEGRDFLLDLVQRGRGTAFTIPNRVLLRLGCNYDTDPTIYLRGVENLLTKNKVHQPYSEDLLAYLLQSRRDETLAFLNIAGQTRNLKTLYAVADGLDALWDEVVKEEERIAREKLAGGPDLSNQAHKLAKQIVNKNI